MSLKKTLFTLNLNPDEYKDITDLTYPLLKHYCTKIGAEFYEIKERKFHDWPPNYEKLQIYQLGKEMENDWNIFLDCDALVSPNCPDWTNFLGKERCAHNGADFAAVRWRYDRYFWRDGRNIGSATWNCIASDWTIELFKPEDELTPAEVNRNIFPTDNELKHGVTPIRLVEDYIMSRNIAKYGLKFIQIKELIKELSMPDMGFYWHAYATPKEQKIVEMKKVLKMWGWL